MQTVGEKNTTARKCLLCGADIADGADNCQFCGTKYGETENVVNVATENGKSTGKLEKPSGKGSGKRKGLVILSSVLAILLIVVGIGYISESGNASYAWSMKDQYMENMKISEKEATEKIQEATEKLEEATKELNEKNKDYAELGNLFCSATGLTADNYFKLAYCFSLYDLKDTKFTLREIDGAKVLLTDENHGDRTSTNNTQTDLYSAVKMSGLDIDYIVDRYTDIEDFNDGDQLVGVDMYIDVAKGTVSIYMGNKLG